MVDSLQIGAAVVVIFVLALTTEILFAFCRVYTWIRRQLGLIDPRVVPPGRYRRGSVSHSWTETTVGNSSSSTPAVAGAGPTTSLPPERINTPLDELMRDVRRETAAFNGGARAHTHDAVDDGPISLSETTHLCASAAPDHTETLHVYDRTERKRSPGLRHHRMLQSTDFAQSMQRDWRSGQFGCGHCGCSLTGQRYILRDDQPYCKNCYDSEFANPCAACGTSITTDYKDLSYKDVHWHDKCFNCSSCSATLINESFAFKNNRLYCATCYEQMFAPRCTRCGHVFRAGMKKYEHRGRQWHADCFVCKNCQKPIGSNSFIPRGTDIICVPCYEHQYSQYCTKCGKTIGKGGIVFNNSPWHRDCFCCSNCQRVLGRERFTTVDDRPCCVQCYGQFYAKFIAFEGRHWHANCFACYKCRAALFGCGFLTDGGGDILCPDCCKED